MNALKTNSLAFLLIILSFFQLSAINNSICQTQESEDCYLKIRCDFDSDFLDVSGNSSSSSSGSSDDEGNGAKKIKKGDILEGSVEAQSAKLFAREAGGELFELENADQFKLQEGNRILFRVTAKSKGGSPGMGEVTVIII